MALKVKLTTAVKNKFFDRKRAFGDLQQNFKKLL